MTNRNHSYQDMNSVVVSPEDPNEVPTRHGHAVLDKTVSVLGGNVQLSDEQFSRIAAVLGLELIVLPKEGKRVLADGTMFVLRNRAKGGAAILFRNYSKSVGGVGRPSQDEPRRTPQSVWVTEAEWNPQTWFSGQNVNHVVDGDEHEFLMLPSETLCYPYSVLARHLEKRGAQNLAAVVREAAEHATFQKLSFNMHLNVGELARDRLLDVIFAAFNWSKAAGLGGKDRATAYDLQKLTGVRCEVYSDSRNDATGDVTGIRLRHGTMTMVMYRKDVQARTEQGRGELRIEVSMTPSTLFASREIRGVLGLRTVTGSDSGRWYASAACLSEMEASLKGDLEGALHNLISLFRERLGLNLFLGMRSAVGWAKLLQRQFDRKFSREADLSGWRARSYVISEMVESWMNRGRMKTARDFGPKFRETAQEMEQWLVGVLGWNPAHFPREAVDLLYRAIAEGTLTADEHRMDTRAFVTADSGVRAELNALALQRVKALRRSTAEVVASGRPPVSLGVREQKVVYSAPSSRKLFSIHE